MPVTPFHFGPGLLVKAAAPTRFSFTAYALANVVIDIESGVNLLTGQTPVHAQVHTFVLGVPVGLALGLLVCLGARALRVRGPRLAAAIWGGGLGGALHILLDGVMHRDIRPFWPFTDANPLLRVVGLQALHLFCVATGVLGLAWLAARAVRRDVQA